MIPTLLDGCSIVEPRLSGDGGPMPRATVVIPNWNGLAHLPECISALAAQTFCDFDVIVVDNGSVDGSVAWLRQNSPATRILERADNGGFAVAVNSGIRATGAECEYVALLNNDTAADPHWLAELVAALDGSSYDMAASLMVLYDSPETVNAAGDDYSIGTFAGRNRGLFRPVSEYAARARVLGACGGAGLYRRALFDEIGFFDEDFFLIHEDTDFNLRALIAGKRCVYVPSALMRHKLSATISAQPSWTMLRLEVRNRAMVIAKDMPGALLPLAAITWPWRLLRSTFPVRRSKWHLVPGLLANFGKRVSAEAEGFSRGWPKRADVWRLRALPTREIIRWLFNGAGPV
jgi:GT2 family glycosyltransferase